MLRITALAACALASAAAVASTNIDARLSLCDPKATTQLWKLGEAQSVQQVNGGACLDVEGYKNSSGSLVWAFSPCHPTDPNPLHKNEAWAFVNGVLQEVSTGMCLDTVFSTAFAGSSIVINKCTAGVATQQWSFDTATGLIKNGVAGYCLDVGSTSDPYISACTQEPAKSMPFCDVTLPVATRVASLIANLTTAEKVTLFDTSAAAVPRLNIPRYQWWSEALHGVGGSPGVSFSAPFPFATSFPQVITTGATFNTSLFAAIGQTISTEGRAMANGGHAGRSFWAPNVNIIRDPRWGRGQETPGEDPFLTAAYAANFVSNMQGSDPTYLRVSSCCKHYYAYDLESWDGVTRHDFNAIVSAQDETETYLPAFQSCVERGQASSIMCSYNAVNGVPSCANSHIMTTLARNTWGFNGYITSDCGAVSDVINQHNYTKTPDATCAAVLNAGMDINCGSYLNSHLPAAVADNAVSIDTVDTALTHLFSVQFRLGMFDPLSIQPYSNLSVSDVNTPAHQALALNAAQQGMVLLKNDGTLPLSPSTVKTVAVIGPNADATTVLQGNYHGVAPYLISPQMGLAKYANTLYAPGCANVACADTTGFTEAVEASKTADATVLVVGIDQSQESEGRDRYNITLPGFQNELIQEVVAAAKGPVIVVVMTGGPLDISVPKALPGVHAIVWCGYPGQSGGQAIADAIFGAYPPAGRLPYTMYPGDYVNQVSMFDMNMRPNASTGNPGHTYKFYTGTPVYSFGDGLSYTTWNVTLSGPASVRAADVAASLSSSLPMHKQAPLATATATVTNTGAVQSDYVVLLFQPGANPVPAGSDPIKSLVGFARVNLAPGASTTVPLPLDATAFSRVNADGQRVVNAEEWRFTVDGEMLSVRVVA